MMAGPNAASNPIDLPKRLPLVVGPENRDDETNKDAKLVNAYVETKPGKEGASETWIYMRPGMDEHQRPPAGNAAGSGVFEWRGDFYSIFGSVLYRNGTSVGTGLNTAGGVYRFSQCLGATPRLQFGNGVFAYNYTVAGGVVVINDVDFPASFVKGWAYLDGTTYVMRTADAGIQGDDINDPVNWNPLNVIIAQVEPDLGKALAKQLVYVIAFKQWSTEVFYDAANAAGSPLGTVQGAKASYGCVSADSVRMLDGILIWVATNKEGSAQVVKMDNLKVEPISTRFIERLLDHADFTTVHSFVFKLDGHRFYVLTIVNENITLVYDLTENRWHQWTDSSGNYFPIVDAACLSTGEHIFQHATNGRLYKAGMSYADDDGSLIQVDIFTPNFDGGVKMTKMLNRLELVCDQKQGAEMQVRSNDNDYDSKSWTNFRTLDLSKKRPTITDCGSFRRRAYNFRYMKPVRMPRVQAVELDMELGTL